MKKLFSLVLFLIIFIWIYAQQMIKNPDQPLNETEKVVVIENNKICCIINESEESIPLVKRYRIEWKQ